MNDPWTGTTGWGLTVEVGSRGGQRGKSQDNCTRTTTTKHFKNKNFQTIPRRMKKKVEIAPNPIKYR